MLYRFKALGKRRDPDQLDTPLTLASPNGWIVTLVIGFCMLALIGWGILGRIPQQVTASGRLQYPGGLVTVQSDSNGIVSGLADLGTVITQGGVIASLHQESGASDTQIVGVTGGRIVQHLVELGTAVTTGTPIAVVEPGATENAILEAIVEVPAAQVEAIQPGQDVKLTVSGVAATKYGLLRGQVQSLAPFPMNADGAQVGPTLVVISLERADTVTGYAWTSLEGPDRQIESQTPVVAEIDTDDISPVSRLGK